VRVHGDWKLTPQRVAVHLPTATAVLADLHLGYCEARQRRGDAVPTPCLDTLLEPLAFVLDHCKVQRVLIAGDLFEDGVDPALAQAWLEWLRRHDALLVGVVPGNHDRKRVSASRGLQGHQVELPVFPGGFRLGAWLVLHGDGTLPDQPVVIGHFHPSMYAAGKNWPCYLVGPRQIVLPAYSLDARGGTLGGWTGFRRLVAVGSQVLDFGPIHRTNRVLDDIHPERLEQTSPGQRPGKRRN
jgi:uncharacterized protein